ncbi:hypothetical protein MKC55_24420 [[Clostridium] innocuum]|nr:hypothetical protein [[Clostridium] innocuum]
MENQNANVNKDEKKQNNQKRNVILVGLALLLVAGAGVGYAVSNNNKSTLPLKEDLIFEYGEVIKLEPKTFLSNDVEKNVLSSVELTSDLMSNAEKYTFDKKKFTVTSKDKKFLDVGEYEVNLKYSKESKEVPFEVKDTKAPIFKNFLTEIRIEQNAENADLKDYFKATDLSGAEITIDKKDFDIKKKGKYDITVAATDKYKNTTEKKSVVVKVVDSKDAEKNGLTETVDGKIPVSKETKNKVDKGETTIKKSEDKVEKPSNDKNNSNSNNNSNNSNEKPNSDKPSKPNNDNNTSKPSDPSHKHKWVEQFKTVHHEEKGHYENVMVADKWIEYKPIYDYQERSICNTCGADVTGQTAEHAEQHMLNGEPGGHHSETVEVQVETEEIVHEAVYEKQWVVDKQAWDEKVSTGFKCDCGATK